MQNKSIALIGMSGAGKSTVGKALSELLGYEFVDVDSVIESAEGMSVAEIFSLRGEEYFRTEESRVTALRAAEKNSVISTGGGAVMNPATVNALKDNCFIVYLAASAKTLCDRVGSGDSRPMIKDNPKDKIEKLLKIRERVYIASCHTAVETDSRTINEISEIICKRYKLWISQS